MVASIVGDQVKSLDREGIVEILSSNTDLKKDNLEKYADRTSETIQKVSTQFDAENRKKFAKNMENRLADVFEGTGRRELDYSLLKNDVRKILDSPKDSLDIIKNRASTFDADTLRAVVTNNKYVSEDQIDRIMETISDSKKEVLDKVGQIETKTHEQIQILVILWGKNK